MKRLNLLKIAAAAALVPAAVWAIDQDITATASFRQALTVAETQILDFDATGPRLEFTGVPDTSVIRVFTDSSYNLTGAFFLPPVGTATAGILTFTGTPAETVNIACDDTAILAEGGGGTIVLSAIEIDMTGGVGVNATDCNVAGITFPVVDPFTIPVGGTQDIHIGGRIVANSGSGVIGAAYSTATAGGNPITIRILYN
jgi:hypothetical protein